MTKSPLCVPVCVTLVTSILTALYGIRCRLKRHCPAVGLVDEDPEHHSDPGIFPADVRFALPQLDVRVAELQDSSAVNSADPM